MKSIHIAAVSAVLFALVIEGVSTSPSAAATSVPGGSYQTDGVTGTFSDVLFNGTLRLRAMTLKDALPADNIRPNAAGDRTLVFRMIVSNGTHHENHGYFDATLADANGITVTGRPLDDGWSLEQGAAARALIGFSVPADFVPTKLVLIEAAAANVKAFRIAIRATDLTPVGNAKN